MKIRICEGIKFDLRSKIKVYIIFLDNLVMESLDDKTLGIILSAQKNEITEYSIYRRLSEATKDKHNKEVLKQISDDERDHYDFWRKYTARDVKPRRFKVWWYCFVARVFGLTFGLRLMERGEKDAQVIYEKVSEQVPSAEKIVYDEDQHEKQLLNMLDEERLKYVSSMVLGLNDALVELTGALAGFTFALQDSRLIGVTGLITGIAASLSMSASEYLSTKSEQSEKNPAKAALYTGFAYVLTVILLIYPYLIFTDVYFCLGLAVFSSILIILLFSFYISVAQEVGFKDRFLEMIFISLGVAGLSFVIGYLVKIVLKVEI
jgi:vacuolar iron transporter family protein